MSGEPANRKGLKNKGKEEGTGMRKSAGISLALMGNSTWSYGHLQGRLRELNPSLQR
jgi:hypothetical protein